MSLARFVALFHLTLIPLNAAAAMACFLRGDYWMAAAGVGFALVFIWHIAGELESKGRS